MDRPSDEILMAFADGQLSPDELARVAEYLEADREAAAVVAAFRLTRTAARDAYAEIGEGRQAEIARLIRQHASEADPSESAGTSGSHGGRSSSSRGTNVVEFAGPRSATSWSSNARSLAAVAAAMILLVAGVVGYRLMDLENTGVGLGELVSIGPVATDGPLARLLETMPTGSTQPAGALGGAALDFVAVATFRDQTGRACREFEAATSDAEQKPVALGVACRKPEGGWAVLGVVDLADGSTEIGSGFQPASGISEGTGMEGLMRMLGASAALSKDEELVLLRSGWE